MVSALHLIASPETDLSENFPDMQIRKLYSILELEQLKGALVGGGESAASVSPGFMLGLGYGQA